MVLMLSALNVPINVKSVTIKGCALVVEQLIDNKCLLPVLAIMDFMMRGNLKVVMLAQLDVQHVLHQLHV